MNFNREVSDIRASQFINPGVVDNSAAALVTAGSEVALDVDRRVALNKLDENTAALERYRALNHDFKGVIETELPYSNNPEDEREVEAMRAFAKRRKLAVEQNGAMSADWYAMEGDAFLRASIARRPGLANELRAVAAQNLNSAVTDFIAKRESGLAATAADVAKADAAQLKIQAAELRKVAETYKIEGYVPGMTDSEVLAMRPNIDSVRRARLVWSNRVEDLDSQLKHKELVTAANWEDARGAIESIGVGIQAKFGLWWDQNREAALTGTPEQRSEMLVALQAEAVKQRGIFSSAASGYRDRPEVADVLAGIDTMVSITEQQLTGETTKNITKNQADTYAANTQMMAESSVFLRQMTLLMNTLGAAAVAELFKTHPAIKLQALAETERLARGEGNTQAPQTFVPTTVDVVATMISDPKVSPEQKAISVGLMADGLEAYAHAPEPTTKDEVRAYYTGISGRSPSGQSEGVSMFSSMNYLGPQLSRHATQPQIDSMSSSVAILNYKMERRSHAQVKQALRAGKLPENVVRWQQEDITQPAFVLENTEGLSVAQVREVEAAVDRANKASRRGESVRFVKGLNDFSTQDIKTKWPFLRTAGGPSKPVAKQPTQTQAPKSTGDHWWVRKPAEGAK